MPTYIIHNNGAYNLYSTISEAARYDHALTLKQLTDEIELESGHNGLQQLPARIERARKKGCSSIGTMSLADCISCNAADLSLDDFIARYLTLPPAAGTKNHD